MSALRAWFMRFGGMFGKRRRDRELAEELESHVQMHVEENLRGDHVGRSAAASVDQVGRPRASEGKLPRPPRS
jgi:hypothetical protein